MAQIKKSSLDPKSSSWDQSIAGCQECLRLNKHCAQVAKEKRKSFLDWEYWGRPVPNFGDPKAKVLVVGLAPAAHGANRTGRMFTGDRSGEWLYRSLYKFGFATRPVSEQAGDGLKLQEALITAVVHCAPPDNKPTLEEIKNCRQYLEKTFDEVPYKVILALGGIAFKSSVEQLKRKGHNFKVTPRFQHGAEVQTKGVVLLASYHPSQQNTFTGRLTETMFDAVFKRAREIINNS